MVCLGAAASRMSLLSSVHLGLPFPASVQHAALLSGPYRYYHYGCDNLDDRGWGCGYRTLQTLCSWLMENGTGEAVWPPVPSLKEIQTSLVEMEDKPPAFAASQDWIGTVEAALCIDHFYSVPSKLIHVPRGQELEKEVETLYAHFQSGGGPVMMGGDRDNSSKGLLGICCGQRRHQLLVLDPHCYGQAGSLTKEDVQRQGWVRWRELGFFDEGSFYNLCLPQFWRRACTL